LVIDVEPGAPPVIGEHDRGQFGDRGADRKDATWWR
jgi:hypothetical protein